MKKTKKSNLEHNRGVFLQIGFFVSLLAIWLIMEWSVPANKPRNKTQVGIAMDIDKIEFRTDFVLNAEDSLKQNKTKQNETNYLPRAEHMPRFKGGKLALKKYTENKQSELSTPETEGIKGKVLVRFVIDSAGWVQQAKVVRSIHPILDQKALKLVRQMPQWIPASQHNNASLPMVLTIAF